AKPPASDNRRLCLVPHTVPLRHRRAVETGPSSPFVGTKVARPQSDRERIARAFSLKRKLAPTLRRASEGKGLGTLRSSGTQQAGKRCLGSSHQASGVAENDTRSNLARIELRNRSLRLSLACLFRSRQP